MSLAECFQLRLGGALSRLVFFGRSYVLSKARPINGSRMDGTSNFSMGTVKIYADALPS